MTVATWQIPNYTVDTGTEYKTNIDGAFAVAARVVDAFSPHEQSTPNMTVRLNAGFLWDVSGSVLTEVAAQSTGTITAPTTNPRIDRVVVDATTGTVSVITGSEAASPVAPAITAGKLPVCQVSLATSTTQIGNSLITDERVFNNVTGHPFQRGHKWGLRLENDSGDVPHDILINEGECRDYSNVINMVVGSGGLTKRFDADWAEGDNAGGIASGARASANQLDADTFYHLFLIAKPDGTVDAGGDTSDTAANLLADATGYSYYRHIGWFKASDDATPNVVGFIHRQINGKELFLYHDLNDFTALDISVTHSTTVATRTLGGGSNAAGCPKNVFGRFRIIAYGGAGASVSYNLFDTAMATDTPANNADPLADGGFFGGSVGEGNLDKREVWVDASQQIKHISDRNDGSFFVKVEGWSDPMDGSLY